MPRRPRGAGALAARAADPLWPRASDWLARGAAEPRFVVVGLPTSAASLSASDAWRAPAALRDALARFSTFDGEAGVELERLAARDLGDWPLGGLDAAEAIAAIGAAMGTLQAGAVHAFVGGDNVVTYPVVARHPAAPLARMGVLTLDAHHDVRAYDGTPSNGAPIRALLDAGLPGDHVVQVGVHSFANSSDYRWWCAQQGIGVRGMDSVDRHGIAAVVEQALAVLADRCDAVHVDVDVDVLDRAFAPGCPGSRPGGMTPRQLATAARICGRHPAVASADFVEVDPAADVADTTVMNLASVFLCFAAGVAERDGRGE